MTKEEAIKYVENSEGYIRDNVLSHIADAIMLLLKEAKKDNE